MVVVVRYPIETPEIFLECGDCVMRGIELRTVQIAMRTWRERLSEVYQDRVALADKNSTGLEDG